MHSGREPGIYPDWDSAKAQTDGYPDNAHQSFTDRAGAADFFERGPPEGKAGYSERAWQPDVRASGPGDVHDDALDDQQHQLDQLELEENQRHQLELDDHDDEFASAGYAQHEPYELDDGPREQPEHELHDQLDAEPIYDQTDSGDHEAVAAVEHDAESDPLDEPAPQDEPEPFDDGGADEMASGFAEEDGPEADYADDGGDAVADDVADASDDY